MKIYMVGGAVRDALLGLPVQDRDWVVTGSRPEDMAAAGFAPVGRDFPVFLHPQTKEEYALARTERKTARGYRGFLIHASPEVTLEQDLARRDLTINAIAVAKEDCVPGTPIDYGKLVDPYGGVRDLQTKVLRHVTEAFREDPVRILRVARFAARFADFRIAPETMSLMRAMVADGEVHHLVAERVWQEIARGLMEAHPARMFEVLNECGAAAVLLPELKMTCMHALGRAAERQLPLAVRYACLQLPQVRSEALRAPTDCSELAALLAREREALMQCDELDAEGMLQLLERCDALRKPQRFEQALQACACEVPDFSGDRAKTAQAALSAVLALSTQTISAQALAEGLSGPRVGARIHDARVAAIAGLQR